MYTFIKAMKWFRNTSIIPAYKLRNKVTETGDVIYLKTASHILTLRCI